MLIAEYQIFLVPALEAYLILKELFHEFMQERVASRSLSLLYPHLERSMYVQTVVAYKSAIDCPLGYNRRLASFLRQHQVKAFKACA
jgi:hypothetical protein